MFQPGLEDSTASQQHTLGHLHPLHRTRLQRELILGGAYYERLAVCSPQNASRTGA
jgi:hypothetical protein